MTTVICLDDYHSLDRSGRKKESVTALDPKAQNFDLMYEQIKDLKAGKTVAKPIYNHVSGLLDPPEDTSAAKVGVQDMPLHKCLSQDSSGIHRHTKPSQLSSAHKHAGHFTL